MSPARRSRLRHASLDMEASPLATMLAHPGMSPEDHAINNDDAQRVQALLTRLPERQRAIVELRLAGLSEAEIDSAWFRAFVLDVGARRLL